MMSNFAPILAAVALAMAACVDTATTTCADGLRCPSDKLCVEGTDGNARCEPANLVLGCMSKPDGDSCVHSSNVPARCRGGICTAMECGNDILDDEEICDDGNIIEGDGCSSDCQRVCGDGEVQSSDEPGKNESCDTARPLEEYCLDRGFDMGTLTCAPSCQDVSTKSCIDFDWQPLPVAKAPPDWQLMRTWVLSPDNVVAVGGKGLLNQFPDLDVCLTCGSIFRFDGNAWTEELTGLPLLLDVWASGPEDIYAVGVLGTILHFDGNEWTQTRLNSDLHPIAIWGTGPDELFVVGMHWRPRLDLDLDTARFMALRYDGRTWAPMDVSQASSMPRNMLHGIWGSGPSDLFAVGSHDTILHYDGNQAGIWSPMDRAPDTTPIGEDESLILDIWGTRADNIVAVGENGRILHYDGAQWSSMESHTNHALTGVWGDGRGQFFAVGVNGTLLRNEPFAGDDWVALASGTHSHLLHIHGSGSSNALAVGTEGTVLRSGDNGWAAMDLQGNQEFLTSIWGSGLDCIYATTEGGTIWHYDGNPDWRWTPMATDSRRHLLGIHGLGCGRDLYAVGWNGTILRHAGGVWTAMTSPTNASLLSVWVGAPDAVFAAGGNGTILRYDGNAQGRWDVMESGVEDTNIQGIWGTSPDNVFAVGGAGTILHYDGNPEGRWTAMSSGTFWVFYAIWGSGPDDVFAVGEGGQFIHFDGERWTSMNGPESIAYLLRSLWGSGAGDVFAGSQNGILFHYDGKHWSPMRSPTDHRITSFWGTADGKHLLLADSLGRIFRLARPGL